VWVLYKEEKKGEGKEGLRRKTRDEGNYGGFMRPKERGEKKKIHKAQQPKQGWEGGEGRENWGAQKVGGGSFCRLGNKRRKLQEALGKKRNELEAGLSKIKKRYWRLIGKKKGGGTPVRHPNDRQTPQPRLVVNLERSGPSQTITFTEGHGVETGEGFCRGQSLRALGKAKRGKRKKQSTVELPSGGGGAYAERKKSGIHFSRSNGPVCREEK